MLFGQLVVEELVKVAPELKVCFRDQPLNPNLSPSDGDREKIQTQAVDDPWAPRHSDYKIFNIRDSGAVEDGKTLDTIAIQKEMDA
jgi:hypothetical protein